MFIGMKIALLFSQLESGKSRLLVYMSQEKQMSGSPNILVLKNVNFTASLQTGFRDVREKKASGMSFLIMITVEIRYLDILLCFYMNVY